MRSLPSQGEDFLTALGQEFLALLRSSIFAALQKNFQFPIDVSIKTDNGSFLVFFFNELWELKVRDSQVVESEIEHIWPITMDISDHDGRKLEKIVIADPGNSRMVH